MTNFDTGSTFKTSSFDFRDATGADACRAHQVFKILSRSSMPNRVADASHFLKAD
jgi:hypothetical protein